MSSKFEQLLDYLVNEEHERANELFHEIVVEKSREIYENLIAEEESEEDEEECTDESYHNDEEDETVESMFGEEDEEDDQFPVQDETDDLEGDVTDPDFGYDGDEEGDDSAPATAGDIQDLEDALDELKAEFEALMAGEKHEEEENPDLTECNRNPNWKTSNHSLLHQYYENYTSSKGDTGKHHEKFT